MATRQYIGARYVPKFFENVNGSNAWEEGYSYEALTIVTYNNASYTSKIPVPAHIGNPYDNKKYWVLTANYNAQVNQYLEEVREISDDFKNVKDSITIIEQNSIASTIVDRSLYAPYAQVLPTDSRNFTSGYSSQGFCIAEINNRPICANLFIDGTSHGSSNIIVFTYLDSGAVIGKYSLPGSGHANSITYSPKAGNFFVACGGGSENPNTVIEVNISGAIVSTYDLGNDIPWAIEWYGDYFYVALSGNRVMRYNTAFSSMGGFLIETDSTYTYQGMFMDENFIYLPCGNTRVLSTKRENRNMISVYTHEGRFYKNIEVMFPLEIEECSIYNNICYLSSNSQASALIVKTDLYRNKVEGYLGENTIDNNNTIRSEIYVNEGYTGFFMDGSETNPFSSINWWTLFVPNNSTNVSINLQSDCPTHVFGSFTNTKYRVTLIGNNHKILRVNFNNTADLVINNLTVIGQDNSYSINSYSNCNIYSSVTIGEPNSSIIVNRCLSINGNYQIDGLTINSSTNGSTSSMYIVGDGYLRNFVINATTFSRFLNCGVMDVDSQFPYNKVNNSNFYGNCNKVCFNHPSDLTIDSSKILYPANIGYIAGTSGNITNLPSGVTTSNLYGYKVDFIKSNTSLVTFLTTSGVVQRVNKL